MMKPTPTLCPCGSNQNYSLCCEPFHQSRSKPESAEKLMRSRYSAYVVQEIDYIAQTNNPSEAESFDREAALEWSQGSEWVGLEIVATRAGQSQDLEGEVEFNARYKREGKEYSHHEVSVFKKLGGQWYYMDGKDIREPERRASPKIGRNDPCSCGSGKKYKKCCAA